MNIMKDRNITVVISARTGSSRLPNKVLLDISGKTALERMIERVNNAKTIDNIIIATSDKNRDDPIEKLCKEINIECIRGSEEDLLSRYQLVVEKVKPDIVAKMGADSILIDPLVIDKVASTFLTNKYMPAAHLTVLAKPSVTIIMENMQYIADFIKYAIY